ncbi:MAG TPA: permease-like cell division protein FtsX [Acidimicrobiales bacterium]|jgi:cell division transport system permease protein|nr:permease-like cell division protein FtsX [Acidimicrobiales bacterium]
MALSLDYVVRETASNLRRNVLMTAAAVLTVAVSLSLVGGALLLKQGVSKASLQWRGGVELSVFMLPESTAEQKAAVETELSAMPEVKSFTFVDQNAAFEEFKEMFANSPDLVESVGPPDLPPSYRIVPKEAEFVDVVGDRFKNRPGVKEVVYAREVVETLLKVTRALQIGIVSVAGVLLLSAVLLILNTIQMAIFARRREVAVMKLVGATNWFIRVPFMLEGMVQGLVGATAAFGVVAVVRNLLAGAVGDSELGVQLLPPASDVVGTGLFVLFAGAAIGTVGSAFAVRRFLDV